VLVEGLEAFIDGMEFGIIGFTSGALVIVVMVELLGSTMVNIVGSCATAYVAILYHKAISIEDDSIDWQ
jgi:hypothetical protein